MITDLTNPIYKWDNGLYYRAADGILFDKSETKPVDNDNCVFKHPRRPEIIFHQTCPERITPESPEYSYFWGYSSYLTYLIEEGDKVFNDLWGNMYFVQHHPKQFNDSYFEKWLCQEVLPHMIRIFESEPNFTKVWEKLPIWLKKPSKGTTPAGQNQGEFVAVLDKNGNRLKRGESLRILKDEPGLKFDNIFFTKEEILEGDHDLDSDTLLLYYRNDYRYPFYFLEDRTDPNDSAQELELHFDFTMTKLQVQAIYNTWKQGGGIDLVSTLLYESQMKPSDELIEALLDETMTEPLTQEEKDAGVPAQYIIVPVIEKDGEPEEQTISVINADGEQEEQTIMVQKTKMKNVMTYKDAVKPHNNEYIVKEFEAREFDLAPAEPTEPFHG